MKVKIKDKIHDAELEPIMIILTKSDKENIANMADGAVKYVCFPDNSMTKEEVKHFANEL